MKTLHQFLRESSDQPIDYRHYPLESKFKHFNQIYFDGQIPDIPVKFGKTPKGTGGVCRIKTRMPGNLRVFKFATMKAPEEIILSDHNIVISHEIPVRREMKWDLLLLHEMIHAWLNAERFIWDNHGPLFIRKAHEVGQKYGHPVPLTDANDAEETAQIVGKPCVAVIFVNHREVVYALLTANWKDKANELKAHIMDREGTYWDNINAYYVPSCVKATLAKLNRTLPLDKFKFRNKEAVDELIGETKTGTVLFTLDMVALKKQYFG